MKMENNHLKMYLLLKNVIFQCHGSFHEGIGFALLGDLFWAIFLPEIVDSGD